MDERIKELQAAVAMILGLPWDATAKEISDAYKWQEKMYSRHYSPFVNPIAKTLIYFLQQEEK